MSDQTNLTNFSGDKKAWPVYMTIGNLPSTIVNRPGPMAILLLGLLRILSKLAKSSRADKLQRLTNADTLRGVFELNFAPLNRAAREGAPIDCAEGMIRRFFPLMSGWIADHMENVTQHGIKSNACPLCEVPPEELGSRAGHHRARDYARYECYERENPYLDSETQDAAHTRYTNETHGMKRGQNIFQGPVRVSTPDLHRPDMLHTIYLGLFKQMMDWIQGFLKKHVRQQAFDNTWKALPTYPGFFVHTKAYREVTQWQEREMRNLGRCFLRVLAVALRQPDSTQVQPVRGALTWVRSLLDFIMMAQYRSHTPESISYMEEYAPQFHETKDIFLEFRISKRTQEKADELRKELRRQRAHMREREPPSARRRIRDNDRDEVNNQRMELIHSESNFNFVKMHLISHFRDQSYMFGNISMYSTEYGELAHKEQIKDRW